jgi:SAM-dependent methyltransferase
MYLRLAKNFHLFEKNMLSKLNKYYLKQSFNPGFISIFINPFYFIRKRLYNAIFQSAHLLKGRILDLGCGSKPYEQLFKNATEYIGIDIENPGHDHSKEDVDIYYDGKTIPVESDSVDGVFFSEVLEHVSNPDEIIQEFSRVLKDGGHLLLTMPFAWDEHEVPNDYQRYSSFGIKLFLEKNNFEIIKYEKTGHFTEVIAQFAIHYLRHILYTKNKYLNLLINLIFIAPFTLCGLILSFILPRIKTLYFNNIVVAKKKFH